MNAVTQPQAEIISPNEAKFWQEQAEKAPALIREKLALNTEKGIALLTPYKIGGVGLGAALGIATFTKAVPAGKWKWASGMASIAALTVGAMAGFGQSEAQKMQQVFLDYANALEKDPAVKAQLANFLSSTVTADMAACGMENVLMERVAVLAATSSHLRVAGSPCGTLGR